MTPFRFVILFVIYFSLVFCAILGEVLFAGFWLFALYVFFEIEGMGSIETKNLLCYILLLLASYLWFSYGFYIISAIFSYIFIALSFYAQLKVNNNNF